MQRINLSRIELFNEIEKSELKPLPVEQYEIRKFKKLKVQFNYHIYLNDDKHYYSVPYQHRGKHVDLLYTDSVIEIYHNNTRIAFHKRDRRKNGYTTLKDHMPANHRWKDDWCPEKLINWAEKKGENVKAVVESILAIKQHPEQGYKICLGLLSLANDYSDHKLNMACRRALYYEQYNLKWIKNILKNGLENVDEEPNLFDQSLPEHENIRGNQYYY